MTRKCTVTVFSTQVTEIPFKRASWLQPTSSIQSKPREQGDPKMIDGFCSKPLISVNRKEKLNNLANNGWVNTIY